jgi:hypothetical protein
MGISGVGGVHPSVGSKHVSKIQAVEPSATDAAPASTAPTSGPKQDTFRGDFSSLVKAVRSGDISVAQSALAALQSDLTSTSATYGPTSTSSTAPAPTASPVQSDLAALFQAVRDGDIAGAQGALGQLEQDVRSTGPGGDHASLQGQIHGRGHGRGHVHQGSDLRATVAAAFQPPASTPPLTTPPVVDAAVEPPVVQSVDPAPAVEFRLPVTEALESSTLLPASV